MFRGRFGHLRTDMILKVLPSIFCHANITELTIWMDICLTREAFYFEESPKPNHAHMAVQILMIGLKHSAGQIIHQPTHSFSRQILLTIHTSLLKTLT